MIKKIINKFYMIIIFINIGSKNINNWTPQMYSCLDLWGKVDHMLHDVVATHAHWEFRQEGFLHIPTLVVKNESPDEALS